MTDPIADLLTRLRNASVAGHTHVVLPSSKVKAAIVGILEREGYVAGHEVVEGGPQAQLRVELKYEEDRKPRLHGVKRVSKPGKRVYSRTGQVPRVMGGLGTAIVSTSKGLMSGREAFRQKLGGELLCYVW